MWSHRRLVHFTVVCVLILSLAPCLAAAGRGTWFWSDDQHSFGSLQVVGRPDREDYALTAFAAWDIDRVYGSFRNRPVDDPEPIAAWNQRLHDHGIASILLLSENTWIYDVNVLLENNIRPKLLDFNAARLVAGERFDALHLDIEPQGLSEWSTMSASDRRDALLLLGNLYAEVRAFLDAEGAPEIPVFADLPVWFDNLGGSIGWASESERDQWFANIATVLTGVSLMPFERSTFASISNGVQWELDTLTCGVRVALEADIGPDRTWSDFAAMMAMAEQIESAWGASIGIDIQSFSQFIDHAPPRVLFLDGFELGDIDGWSSATN